MKTKKMSLANIHGKLSRAEMKNIMAGSECGGVICNSCTTDADCAYKAGLYCGSTLACPQYLKVCRRTIAC